MITANDIIEHLSEISKTEDRIVDEWLTDVFLKRAVQSGVTNLTFLQNRYPHTGASMD